MLLEFHAYASCSFEEQDKINSSHRAQTEPTKQRHRVELKAEKLERKWNSRGQQSADNALSSRVK